MLVPRNISIDFNLENLIIATKEAMARPKNKTELLQLSKDNFERLMIQAEEITSQDRQLDFPKGYLNRNVKDVLAHVHEWHNMSLDWYEKGMAGLKPDMPKKGYTWKTLPDLNREIWNSHKGDKYEGVLKNIKDSHKKVQNLIDSHTNEELFTKKKYKWTGSTSMGSYLVSNTSSHYDWAYKLIKKCTK